MSNSPEDTKLESEEHFEKVLPSMATTRRNFWRSAYQGNSHFLRHAYEASQRCLVYARYWACCHHGSKEWRAIRGCTSSIPKDSRRTKKWEFAYQRCQWNDSSPMATSWTNWQSLLLWCTGRQESKHFHSSKNFHLSTNNTKLSLSVILALEVIMIFDYGGLGKQLASGLTMDLMSCLNWSFWVNFCLSMRNSLWEPTFPSSKISWPTSEPLRLPCSCCITWEILLSHVHMSLLWVVFVLRVLYIA